MMLEKIFLILMIVIAIMSWATSNLKRAVIYLGLLSLISSFVYLLYSAPDVAIAEAVIASGISTVLYLVAIKKSKIITIYHIIPNSSNSNTKTSRNSTKILNDIKNLLSEKELEIKIINSQEDHNFILNNVNFDLLIYSDKEKINILGSPEHYHFDSIEKLFSDDNYKNFNINIMRRGIRSDS